MDEIEKYGISREIQSGSNFGYLLKDSSYFVNTDYKVLQSQTSGIFIPCMKMLYNGKIELYYVIDEFQPLQSIFFKIQPDALITIMINMFANVIEVRNNGFLTCQNIVISWDKVFVDPNTLKVKLVYIPVKDKLYDNDIAFESDLRSSIVKLINKGIAKTNSRLDQFALDMSNGSLSLEDVYNKSRDVGSSPIMNTHFDNRMNRQQGNDYIIKIVAMNAPQHFEIIVDRDDMLIGKKADLVDAVIPFNKMISRRHCRVTKQNEFYYITDIGSANGTYINGVRLQPNQPCQINKGDIIRLADSDFQIV